MKNELTNPPFSGKSTENNGIPRKPVLPKTIANSVIFLSSKSFIFAHKRRAMRAITQCKSKDSPTPIRASFKFSTEYFFDVIEPIISAGWATIIMSFESPFDETSSMIFVLPRINPTIRTKNIVITILKNPEKSKVILQQLKVKFL